MACSATEERDEVADQQFGVGWSWEWKEEEGRRGCLGQAFLTKSSVREAGNAKQAGPARLLERGEARATEARARATPLYTAGLAPTAYSLAGWQVSRAGGIT
jgi:hypothetical protein